MKDFNLGEAILGFFSAYWNVALWVAIIGVVLYSFGLLIAGRREGANVNDRLTGGPIERFFRMMARIFGNWQLALLGTTAILLSLVSGYTTWDGMSNFTRQPLISMMATFGIQGVMLITSWLIGETFARGATGEAESEHGVSRRAKAMETAHSSFPLLVGAIILGLLVGLAYLYSPAEDIKEFSVMYGRGITWTAVGLGSFLFVAFILIIFSQTAILGAYAHGARIILANLHLWVMFLACMATSVFFSFDSHFSSIFPAEERQRAAEIRAINQVASTVADIGGLIQKRQLEEAEKLFKSPSWEAYEKQLDATVRLSEKAPTLIREQITRELEEQKSRIASLEEKRATAQGGQAGLLSRKAALTEDLSRLQGQRPTEAAEAQTDKAKVVELERTAAEQKVKTAAEEKGVEGSGKIGRGQFYRASKAEEDKLVEQLKIARERLRNSDGRLTATDRRISTIKSELAQIDGDLAKLKGEAETAGQLITVAQTNNKADAAQKFDPAAGVGMLERERQTFRQKPDQSTLANIQNACMSLLSAGSKVPSLRDDAARIDCEPREASEAAARVFALNAGIVAFSANCVGGDKLPQTGGTNALLSFGRKCLQDSGLPSKDSAAVGARLSAVDLNRDDKAHRFVVTWNAFLDGNRLAYLALSIAIALDGLVFMSGLFGANAVASPLSNTPEAKRRSVQDLEKVIYSALRPEPVNSADLAVNLMEPIRLPQYPGFTVFVDLNPMTSHEQKFAVRKVLTAGSGLGLVSHVGDFPSIYLIRRELHEYLLKVSGDEHDRGRRPDPAKAVPQLDAAASHARAFLSHYARMSPHGHAGHALPSYGGGAHAGRPGDYAMDVTPQQPRLTHLGGTPYAQAALPPAPPVDDTYARRQGQPQPSDAREMPPQHQAAHISGEGMGIPAAAGYAANDLDVASIDADAPSTDLVARFLEPLGMSRSDYEILTSGGLEGEVTDAVYAVDLLAKSDKTLGDRLRRMDQTKLGNIKMIAHRNPGSKELADDLEGHLPSLVLFGIKGYAHVLDTLIAQMEGPGGEGRLSLSDDLRYRHLKRHQSEIARLWNIDRRSPTGWKSLTDEIIGLAQALAHVRAAADDDRSRQQGVPYHGEPGHG